MFKHIIEVCFELIGPSTKGLFGAEDPLHCPYNSFKSLPSLLPFADRMFIKQRASQVVPKSPSSLCIQPVLAYYSMQGKCSSSLPV